jgi:thiol-disulfide isomerase/thioredoxin
MNLKPSVVWLCFLAGAGAVAGPRAPQAAKTAAVRDPELIDAQGYLKLVRQYQGQPLLVNFWATWCEPCRDEYPMLNELAKQYAPQGLKVVGVNLDQDGDLILMRRFIARYKPIFPNYRRKPSEPEEAFRLAVLPGWTGSLPISVFYGKDGRQAGNFVGQRNREAYEGAIRSLLNSGSR